MAMAEIQDLINTKWNPRAEGYRGSVEEQLLGPKRTAWLELITSQAPELDRPLEVLDVGTGPGFFAIVLSQIGWRVRGVDRSEKMLAQARDLSAKFGVAPEYELMDNHSLDFPDGSFDLLLSRDVTWCLREPEAAYKEWRRVLRPGGTLLIFDSNWYRYLFDDEAKKAREEDIREASERFGYVEFVEPDQKLADSIYPVLPMGRNVRPDWDVETLGRLGFTDFKVQPDVSHLVRDEVERIAYRSAPIFSIRALA